MGRLKLNVNGEAKHFSFRIYEEDVSYLRQLAKENKETMANTLRKVIDAKRR